MTVSSIGSNMTEVKTDNKTILVSYETPVAAVIDGKKYYTIKRWSASTSKHINKWLGKDDAEEMPQSFFDNLLK